jgi:hypothetical protein
VQKKHQTAAVFQQENIYLYFFKIAVKYVDKSASVTADMHSPTDSENPMTTLQVYINNRM